jgi:hypothetical protein
MTCAALIKGVMIEPVVTTEEDFKQVHEHDLPHAHEEERAGAVARRQPPRLLTRRAFADAPKVSAEDLDLMQNEVIRDLDLNAASR